MLLVWPKNAKNSYLSTLIRNSYRNLLIGSLVCLCLTEKARALITTLPQDGLAICKFKTKKLKRRFCHSILQYFPRKYSSQQNCPDYKAISYFYIFFTPFVHSLFDTNVLYNLKAHNNKYYKFIYERIRYKQLVYGIFLFILKAWIMFAVSARETGVVVGKKFERKKVFLSHIGWVCVYSVCMCVVAPMVYLQFVILWM